MVYRTVVAAAIDNDDRSSGATTRSSPADIRKIGIDPEFWYPLARASELLGGRIISTSFTGDPVASARTDQGKVFALEDRYAHRQAPLRAGVVAGDCLQCGYHGWTNDASGRCIDVPYLDVARGLPNGPRLSLPGSLWADF